MPRSALAILAAFGLMATACSTGPAPMTDQSPPNAVERAQQAQEATDRDSTDRAIYATSHRQRPADDAIDDNAGHDDAESTDRHSTPHLAFHIADDQWQTPAGDEFDADDLQRLLDLSQSPLLIEAIVAPDADIELDALLDQIEASGLEHDLQVRRGDLPEVPEAPDEHDEE